MIDWHESMEQTFEFFEVDPNTWRDKRRITSILSCSIKRDISTDTLETATLETTDIMGECYIRIYLIAKQNYETHREPLGTFIVQTPSFSYDGKIRKVSIDAYSPLLELKDAKLPIGFSLLKKDNIMDNAYNIISDNMRAPVVKATGVLDTLYENYVSDIDEDVLSYVLSLIKYAEYSLALDPIGGVMFSPKQDLPTLQPTWTYDDSNSSILYPDIDDSYDLYGIPNVVEVIYSGEDGSGRNVTYYSKVVNDNPSSPISTVTRGRIVLHRETSPSISGNPTQEIIDHYAKQLLKDLNTVEHTINYSHGYCPVKIGDCVRLDYKRAGINNVKAKVISQNIDCKSGCVVSETAVYTENLWRDETS